MYNYDNKSMSNFNNKFAKVYFKLLSDSIADKLVHVKEIKLGEPCCFKLKESVKGNDNTTII